MFCISIIIAPSSILTALHHQYSFTRLSTICICIWQADVAVLYVDYGNRASVPRTKLGALPAAFVTPGGYAKLYSVALVCVDRGV